MPFYRLIKKIDNGQYVGKQIDWGAYAARVSKQEILDFIQETYQEDDWYTDPKKMPHLYDGMQRLLECVKSLPDDREFVLVASEF